MNDECRLKLLNERECRVTGATDCKIDAHRLIPSGDYTPDNVMPLSHELHVFQYHSGLNRMRVARMIREVMTLEEEAYIVGRKGEGWLDRTYPPSSTDIL